MILIKGAKKRETKIPAKEGIPFDPLGQTTMKSLLKQWCLHIHPQILKELHDSRLFNEFKIS